MHKLAHTSSTTTALEFMNGMEAYEEGGEEEDEGRMGAVKEMMYKMAAMQPVDIDPATIKKPKRRNVRISEEPQSVVARQRRERISERMRILQRMVPGGTKMDTASMLDEAVRYVKFLQRQVQELQAAGSAVVPVLVQEAHAVFVNGVADMEWVSHGHGHASSSSSSSSAIGAPATSTGLGFGFTTTTNATNNH